MDASTLRIALTSLTRSSGTFPGWESVLHERFQPLSNQDQKAIALAQVLSFGGNVKVSDRQGQIENIYSTLSLSDKSNAAGTTEYLPMGKLTLEKGILFPSSNKLSKEQITQYQTSFQNMFDAGIAESPSHLEALLATLQTIGWCVPSDSNPRVSYFDQQRVVAALAVCLRELDGSNVEEILNSINENKVGSPTLSQPVAMLVGGDISGIQNFIYTITAKGAAKSLRGRSFYLQLLTEAILRFVLRELELPYTNVIYSGGGHFFLLAPVSRKDKLENIQLQITNGLWKHHRGSLYFALGSSEVPASGFLNGNFPGYWGKMHASIGRRKQKRYSELGTDWHSKVFALPKYGGNPDETCSVCGEDHRKTRKWDDLDIQENICSLCDSFIEEIGKKLPRSNFIVMGFDQSKETSAANVSDALSEFGLRFQFMDDHKGKVNIHAEQVVIWALDDPDKDQWPQVSGVIPKWIRYTANHVPVESFDELQEKVQGGFERLGVLRMDVDNLGDLFKTGFGSNATITQLASLSFRTSLFFEGWLKALCEKKERRGLIYTVYAGGDDVFLIGPWDLIPDLAREIVSDFSEYTGGNPDVHLSAGMAFIRGKYPVYQAADDAGDAIDESKRMNGKNGFTFLDMPWKWNDFEKISQKQKQLDDLVLPKANGKKSAPQAILQVLQQLALEERQHEKSKGRHVWGRWIWMGIYQLTRMQERNKDLVKEIGAIRDGLQENNYLDIHQWGVAARWTQLSTRKKGKEEAK